MSLEKLAGNSEENHHYVPRLHLPEEARSSMISEYREKVIMEIIAEMIRNGELALMHLKG